MKQKIQQHLRRFFTENLSLKLAAVLLAVIFWIAFVTIEDPVTTDTYQIGVTVENLTEFMAADQHIELKNGKDISDVTLRVTVQARGSILNELKQKDISTIIKASVDVYEVEGGALKIKYEIDDLYKDKIELPALFNTSYLEVKTEGRSYKNIPVKWTISGSVAEGYTYFEKDENIFLSQDTIDVEGPDSKIAEFSYAHIHVKLDGETENVTHKLELSFHDEKGSSISFSKDVISTSVNVVTITIPVYKVKTITVRPQIMGETAAGYVFMDDEALTVGKVQICGKEDLISRIRYLDLPEVSLENLTGNFSQKYNLENLLRQQYGNDVYYYDSNKETTLSFSIAEKEVRQISFTLDRLQFKGLPEGWEENWVIQMDIAQIEVVAMGLAEDLDIFEEQGVPTLELTVDPMLEGEFGPYEIRWDGLPDTVTIEENMEVTLQISLILPEDGEDSNQESEIV